MARKIVGAFNTEQEATRAIEDLKQQGYSTDDISVIAKDRDDVNAVTDETETKAPEGLASGAATGGLLGGVTGLLAGLGALAIPGIGPIVAAGPIAATLTGAAVGAGAGGLVGGLIGLGIPEDEAREYDEYVEEGRILVMVEVEDDRSGSVYDTFRRNNTLNAHHYGNDGDYTGTGAGIDTRAEIAEETEPEDPNLYHGLGAGNGGATGAGRMNTTNVGEVDTNRMRDSLSSKSKDNTGYMDNRGSMLDEEMTEERRSMKLREEKLDVDKERVQSGEVKLRKEVIEETKSIDVPVTHEEVVIERHSVNDEHTDGDIGDSETVRIPVSEERVEVNKRPVVTGEVEVRKERVQDTEHIRDTVKKEQAHVDQDGDASVRGFNPDPTANDERDPLVSRRGLNNNDLDRKKF